MVDSASADPVLAAYFPDEFVRAVLWECRVYTIYMLRAYDPDDLVDKLWLTMTKFGIDTVRKTH